MKKWPSVIAGLVVLIFSLFFCWYTVTVFHKLNLHRFDLGNMEQLIWNFTSGHGYVMTDPYTTNTVSRLAFHVDPFIILLALPYSIFPTTETLIIIQVLAVASGIWAMYLLGKKIIGSSWAGVIAAVLCAFCAPLIWATIFPVHAVTFATPIILWMVWAALEKRWSLMYVLAFLAILTKEQVGLSVAIFGLWLWFKQKEIIPGKIMTIVPLVWSLVAIFAILPAFRAQSTSDFQVYSTPFGNSGREIVVNIVKHPGSTVKTVFQASNVNMVAQTLVSTGWLAIGSPLSLAAFPDLMINGFSSKIAQKQLTFQYQGSLLPWLLVGTLLTWAFLEKKMAAKIPRKITRAMIATWLIGWAAVAVYGLSPLPGATADRLKYATWRNEYAAEVRQLAKTIPVTAKVSASNSVGAQFARREHLYTFPIIGDADYIIDLANHGAAGVYTTPEEMRAIIAKYKSDPSWVVVSAHGDLTVLKKIKVE